MATTMFLDPGGDSNFSSGNISSDPPSFYPQGNGPTIVSDFVHGAHIRSTKFAPNGANFWGKDNNGGTNPLDDAGRRISVYIYLVALPTSTASLFWSTQNGVNLVFSVRITSAGVLQIWDAEVGQIGTNGATLKTGVWTRLSLAYTITNTTTNRFELFKDAASTISVTNATLTRASSFAFYIGNHNSDTTLDFRASDVYIDTSNSLKDTGDVWVAAKRPNANGTTNGFTTQIGSGGSGYGTGHSPQVNERPGSNSNGWSIATSGTAITEEYAVEGISVGDFDLTNATSIVDVGGWASCNALVAATGTLIVAGASVSINIGQFGQLMRTGFAGTTTYPSGGNAIGIITDTSSTTFSLYDCGLMIAFIPGPEAFDAVTTSESVTVVEAWDINEAGTQLQGIKVLPPGF
jgi:hypothetical protein